MTDLALPDLAPAPTTLFASDDPEVVVRRATRIAETIAPLIRQQNLVKRIGQSEHVYVEAWALAGSMLGVFAITVRTWEIGEDQGYGATVEARTLTGNVVGRADAVVMRDEEVGGKRKWLEAPAFQLISMAQTRGSSKALRMPLGFVMKLAGYETTPAEEMEAAAARGETVSGGKGVRPGWRDIGEQQRAHAEVGTLIDNLGARQWVAEWLDSKSYERPLAKAQLNQLRKAIEREFEQSGGSSGTTDTASGDSVSGSPPDLTSEGGGHGPRLAHPAREATPPSPDPKSPHGPTEQEVSPTEADRSGAEGAHVDGTESGTGTSPPDATPPPEGSSSPGRPSGGPKRSRPAGPTSPGAAGRATSSTTTGRGTATDATSSVKQAGSGEPQVDGDGAPDPSLLPEPEGWERP